MAQDVEVAIDLVGAAGEHRAGEQAMLRAGEVQTMTEGGVPGEDPGVEVGFAIRLELVEVVVNLLGRQASGEVAVGGGCNKLRGGARDRGGAPWLVAEHGGGDGVRLGAGSGEGQRSRYVIVGRRAIDGDLELGGRGDRPVRCELDGRALLAAVVAPAIGVLEGGGGLGRTCDGQLGMKRPKVSALGAPEHSGGGIGRQRVGVEHAAQHGRSQGHVQGAAVDLEPGEELGIEQAEVEGTVGPGERETVDQQGDTPAGGGAVEAGATDRETRRLEAAKAFLQHHAGDVLEGLGQRGDAAARPVGGGDGGRRPEGGGKIISAGNLQLVVERFRDNPRGQDVGCVVRHRRLGAKAREREAKKRQPTQATRGSPALRWRWVTSVHQRWGLTHRL